MAARFADDLRDRFRLGGHGLDVEDHAHRGAVELLRKRDRFGGGVDEVGLAGGEGLEADRDAAVGRAGDGGAEHVRGPGPRLRVRHPRGEAALFRRTDDDRLAADVRAEIGEGDEVVGGALADGGVGLGEVQAVGLHEDPVDAGDFQTDAGGGVANGAAFGGRDGRDIFVGGAGEEGERGELDAVVAGRFRVGHGVGEGPVLENLVADTEFHERG